MENLCRIFAFRYYSDRHYIPLNEIPGNIYLNIEIIVQPRSPSHADGHQRPGSDANFPYTILHESNGIYSDLF